MSIFPESMAEKVGGKRTTTETVYYYVLDPIHGELTQFKNKKDY